MTQTPFVTQRQQVPESKGRISHESKTTLMLALRFRAGARVHFPLSLLHRRVECVVFRRSAVAAPANARIALERVLLSPGLHFNLSLFR